MCLNRHFHTFEPLRTPPHKTQKSCQNDHRTIRFCNGLGRHPNLRISRHSKNAFKPTFSSLWSWMRLNRHFHTFELLRTPPHKPQKIFKTMTKPFVFAMVWECMQTLGFQVYFGTTGWLESKKPEVDDISVHFGILTAQVPQGLGSQACLSGPFRGIGWSACPATSVGACNGATGGKLEFE